MTSLFLIRYNELFLKSDPVRRQWERTLIDQIRSVFPDSRVRSERGRIWVEGDVDQEQLARIFGIASFSEVDHVPLALLTDGLLSYCRGKNMERARTFAIRVKRVGSHNFTSQQKAIELGDLIRKEYPHLRVDLASPDRGLFIEIRGDDCYLFTSVVQGVGGLPPGVEGTLIALISGGIDSPVAAWMMMKRGCRIIPLYVHLDGVLDASNDRRTQSVIEALRRYQPDITLTVIRDSYLSQARDELARSGQEKYTCIFCKRRMYRVAETFARSVGARGIVTGESLGQVASQTLDNLLVLNEAATIPVYRPLIGLDKEDTIRIARGIGTFSPSISPASGCRAVPRGPSTKADLEKIRAIEQDLDATLIPVPV
jgi:thiamine biosynthesis protein ThiI